MKKRGTHENTSILRRAQIKVVWQKALSRRLQLPVDSEQSGQSVGLPSGVPCHSARGKALPNKSSDTVRMAAPKQSMHSSHQAIRIRKGETGVTLSDQLAQTRVVSCDDGDATTKHVNNFHGQIQAAGTDMQTDANISGSEDARIIVGGEPDKPDGDRTERDFGQTMLIVFAQGTTASDDDEKGESATLPMEDGVEEEIEGFIRGPTGAGDQDGGWMVEVDVSGAELCGEGMGRAKNGRGVLNAMEKGCVHGRTGTVVDDGGLDCGSLGEVLGEGLGDGPVVVDEADGEEFEELGEGDEEGVEVIEGHKGVGEIVDIEGDLGMGEEEGAGEEEDGEDGENWGGVEDDESWVVEGGAMEGAEKDFGVVDEFCEKGERGAGGGDGGGGRGNWNEENGGRGGGNGGLGEKDDGVGGCEIVKGGSMGEGARGMVGGGVGDDEGGGGLRLVGGGTEKAGEEEEQKKQREKERNKDGRR